MIEKHSEQTKAKISSALKGKSPWNKGLKNAQPPRQGFQHSDESKQKISQSKKGISIASKGKPSWRKGISKKIPESKICLNCNNLFDKNLKKTDREWQERKYCSSKCALSVAQKNRLGTQLPDEWRKNLSVSHLGKTPANKGKKSLKTSGENNPNWKGGVSSYRCKLKSTLEYKKWRHDVFERDGHKCVNCNSTKDLRADHIKPVSKYPELIHDIDNGRVLCRDCDYKIGYQYFKEDNPKREINLCHKVL
jgi:hypothetical protein